MKKSVSAMAAALLACVASQAIAADSPSRQAERDLFAKIVEIPTVEGRTAEFGKLTTLLTADLTALSADLSATARDVLARIFLSLGCR